jgi:hypothetical protein
VPPQFVLQIRHVGAHRCKALDLLEKWITEQPAKITYKIERVIHSQWRQSVLRKNVKPAEQTIEC